MNLIEFVDNFRYNEKEPDLVLWHVIIYDDKPSTANIGSCEENIPQSRTTVVRVDVGDAMEFYKLYPNHSTKQLCELLLETTVRMMQKYLKNPPTLKK